MDGEGQKRSRPGGRHPSRISVEREIRVVQGVWVALDDSLMRLDETLIRMWDEPLRNGLKVTDTQLGAAMPAAPYLHPKQVATTTKGDRDSPLLPPIPEDARKPFGEILAACSATGTAKEPGRKHVHADHRRRTDAPLSREAC